MLDSIHLMLKKRIFFMIKSSRKGITKLDKKVHIERYLANLGFMIKIAVRPILSRNK